MATTAPAIATIATPIAIQRRAAAPRSCLPAGARGELGIWLSNTLAALDARSEERLDTTTEPRSEGGDLNPAREAWPHQHRPAAGAPDGALVLLHGRGTDEFDLLPLLDALDPERRLVGLTPRAPLSLPPGGAHWYVVRQVGYPDRETFDASFEGLSAWLDALPPELGVPWERVVLGGFSMGAVMSYATALGPGRPTPAGVMALSGFMPTVEGFELELDRARRLPVAIAHGTADPVISVEFGRDARRRLEAAGADVTYRESPVPHTIDPAIVPDLRHWLAAAIPPPEDAEPR
jgi:phospholipase/carboxylesterase